MKGFACRIFVAIGFLTAYAFTTSSLLHAHGQV
jgi:hypothetical protein